MAVDEETLAALREAITEGRELLQDMKYQKRRFKNFLDEVRKETSESVRERIDAQVKIGLDEYKATLEKATVDATKAVFKRFDTLADILMGTDDPNKESLATLLRKWKADGN